MKQYTVTGMSCAACVARVEKAVSAVEGVDSVSVNLLTNSMGVEGNANSQDVIKAVCDAGYGASEKKHKSGISGENTVVDVSEDDMIVDRETPVLIKRLILSVAFLIPLMYFSMGHMMWGWPIPRIIENNHMAMGMIQMLFTIVIMIINSKFFVSGVKGLLHKSPNMDTLVAMGATAAFGYSVYALFAMSDAYVRMDMEDIMRYMDEFYFESVATILTLITVGKTLEARSKGKTTDALKGLMKLAPKTATILIDGEEKTVPISNVKIDDIFVVRPGESIPVDGIIIEGATSINESALTGESIPADKQKDDEVSAATLNLSGFVKCRATRVGEDTTLSKIIQMVSEASATKAPIARIADKVSGVFVPVVICIAAVTFIVWLICGQTLGYAMARAVSVLVISCPCALGLATPVAIMVGNGLGAKNGILFKTSASLEQTGKTDIVVLDKTGTVTNGEPIVTDICLADGISDNELLEVAYALEKNSEHPLAKAINDYCEQKNISPAHIADFKALTGSGVYGLIDGKAAYIGSGSFIKTKASDAAKYDSVAAGYSDNGKTPLYICLDKYLLGIIAVADTIKADSKQAISELKNMGIRVIMLTGDNERTAKAIGEQAGVDKVIAGVYPDQKGAVISSLKALGKVVMVGDGINDAPALTTADIGIAIGAGTDIAIDAADVVLMKSRLMDVPAAIKLSRATVTNIRENLFWAFIYNVIGIPLAAGVYVKLFGWSMNPMFGALAMSLSSVSVVTNALRLNLFKLYKPGSTKEASVNIEQIESAIDNIIKKETKEMTKTMKINGMMCGNCEKHVKKALEAIEGVESAEVSHEEGTAVVTMNAEIADTVLTEAVTEEGYEVTGIE